MLNFSIAVISNHVKKIRQHSSRLLICFVPLQSLVLRRFRKIARRCNCHLSDSQSADRFIAVVSADIYSLNGFMKSIFFMVHLKRKIVLIVQCTMTLWCTRVLKVVAVHQLVESWSLPLSQRVIGQSHRSTCFLFLWSTISDGPSHSETIVVSWIPFFRVICYIFHECAHTLKLWLRTCQF